MTLGRSSLGVFGSNGLNVLLSFGNSILLTRTLGVVGKGEFAIFSASYGLLSLLLGLGLDVALRYHVARDRVPREQILTSTIVYSLTAGALVVASAHLNHRLFSNELFLPASKQSVTFELVLGGVVAATLFHSHVASVFAGTRSFRTLNVTVVGFALVSLIVYGALFLGQTVLGLPIGSDEVFLAYLGLSVFNGVVLSWLAYRELGLRPSMRLIDGRLLLDMTAYAGLAFGANLAQFLNYRIDFWIVQGVAGAAALGLYSLATNLAMMLWVLPRSAATVILPMLAAGDTGGSAADTARLGRIVLAASAAVALPLAVIAPWWIHVLYGAEFRPSALPFMILLVGTVPFTVCIVQAGALAAFDLQRVNLVASLLGLVATVALDLLLIPRYGIVGAAAASATSYVLTTVVVLRAFARRAGLPLAASLLLDRSDLDYVIDGCKRLLR